MICRESFEGTPARAPDRQILISMRRLLERLPRSIFHDSRATQSTCLMCVVSPPLASCRCLLISFRTGSHGPLYRTMVLRALRHAEKTARCGRALEAQNAKVCMGGYHSHIPSMTLPARPFRIALRTCATNSDQLYKKRTSTPTPMKGRLTTHFACCSAAALNVSPGEVAPPAVYSRALQNWRDNVEACSAAELRPAEQSAQFSGLLAVPKAAADAEGVLQVFLEESPALPVPVSVHGLI